MRVATAIFSVVFASMSFGAPCTGDGEAVILTWTHGGHEYGWQLLTESTGVVNSIEIVGRSVPGSGAWTDSVSLTPVGMPTSAWFLGQAQLMASAPGDASCMLRQAIEYDLWWDSYTGFTYELKTAWLRGDHDGDGIINLDDADALIVCDSPFSFDSCNIPESTGGLPQPIIDPPSESVGTSAPFPYVTGSYTTAYGCTLDLAFGGSSITAYAGKARSAVFLEWAAEYWKNPAKFGDPGHPKPYEGAYNLVRGGPGGAETAYFSAVWGKRVTYLLSGATDATFGNNLREGSAVYWHRYFIQGTKVYFQYWHYTSNCWRPLGMDINGTGGTTSAWIALSHLHYFAPDGFMPGDVQGETYSNIVSGASRLPIFGSGYSGFSVTASGSWSADGGGGQGLTQGQVEEAFSRALAGQTVNAAGQGALAMGTMLGQGAGGDGGAVEGLFGEGYTEAGLYQLGAANTAAGEFATGLESMATGPLAFGTLGSSAQGSFDVALSLPIPGHGDYVTTISTMPDTSWAPGSVLNGARILFRVLCSLLLVYRFVFAVLGVLGWK